MILDVNFEFEFSIIRIEKWFLEYLVFSNRKTIHI